MSNIAGVSEQVLVPLPTTVRTFVVIARSLLRSLNRIELRLPTLLGARGSCCV